MDTIQYYIFFAVIFAFYHSMKQLTKIQFATENEKVQYLFLVMFALWILVGMRNVLYGRDTFGYVMEFRESTFLSLNDIAEPGFKVLCYIVRSITDNYHVYLMVTSFSTIVAMYKLMRRYFSYSYEILAAICIYVLLGILAFNMAALRQSIALSLGIFAFIYADGGKWKKYLLCVGIAYLFHNSSFILLLIYPLRYIDARRYGLIAVSATFAIGVIASGTIVSFLQSYLPMEDRFAQYGTMYESSQNYTGFALQLILVLVAYLRRDYIKLPSKTKNLFFNMAYIGLAVQSLTMSLAELYRVSFYFCVFDIVLVPLALSSYTSANASTIRNCFIIGCLFYIFVLSGAGVLPLPQAYRVAF